MSAHASVLAEGWARVDAFVGVGTKFVFDFDGTLAPIGAKPEDVAMRGATRTQVERLSQRADVTILSGRARGVLQGLVAMDGVRLIGNHGAEWDAETPPPGVTRLMQRWREQLRVTLPAGVLLEDKGWTLSVHWRGIKDRAVVRQAQAAVRALPSTRLVAGKSVVNVIPQGLPTKADAVVELLRKTAGANVLFMGDDVTDEDVFVLKDPRVLSVRIGSSTETAARLFVPDQRRVDEFLERLLVAR